MNKDMNTAPALFLPRSQPSSNGAKQGARDAAVPLLKRQREDIDAKAKRVRASSASIKLEDLQRENAALRQEKATLQRRIAFVHSDAALARQDARVYLDEYIRFSQLLRRQEAETRRLSDYLKQVHDGLHQAHIDLHQAHVHTQQAHAALQRAREDAEAMSECCICTCRMSNGTCTSPVAVDPCGHVFCAQCAERLEKCPICRGPMLIKYSIVLPFA